MFKEKIFEGYFYNPTKRNFLIEEVIEEVIEEMVMYMKEKPEKFYDIIIGCDSSSGNEPNFPLVVAILRIWEGGRFFLKRLLIRFHLIINFLVGRIVFFKRFSILRICYFF